MIIAILKPIISEVLLRLMLTTPRSSVLLHFVIAVVDPGSCSMLVGAVAGGIIVVLWFTDAYTADSGTNRTDWCRPRNGGLARTSCFNCSEGVQNPRSPRARNHDIAADADSQDSCGGPEPEGVEGSCWREWRIVGQGFSWDDRPAAMAPAHQPFSACRSFVRNKWPAACSLRCVMLSPERARYVLMSVSDKFATPTR
jgi:hypothetical protein